jgi:hypothetical protein
VNARFPCRTYCGSTACGRQSCSWAISAQSCTESTPSTPGSAGARVIEQGIKNQTPRRGQYSPAAARLGWAMRQRLTSKPTTPSRPGHDQRAVTARAALPRTRAGEPRAGMRACSYHASPGPGQGNVLWIRLWMIYVNTLVSLSTAVDEGCCGKVDNRCEAGSCQVAGLPPSTGRYEVSTG